MTSEIEYKCNNCGHEGLNTRAVPDVPELVTVARQYRWGGESKWRPFPPIFDDEPRETRELVSRDQAVLMLAAKDAEILKHRLNTASAIREGLKEVGALKAELAQIKAQEPVAYLYRHGTGLYMHTDGSFKTEANVFPLYSASVAQMAHHTILERLIRYVDAMAGEGFDDATEIMLDLFKEYNVDSAENLIKKLLTT